MSKETELRTFSRLAEQGQLAWASLPKSVKSGAVLQELLATNILTKERSGAGSIIRLLDPNALKAYLDQRFPGRDAVSTADAVSHQQRYRDSKGAAKTSIGVVLLRGWTDVNVNGQTVHLSYATSTYGCFAAVKPALKAKRFCLVENLDCFMKAEAVLDKQWVFAHTYGRLGKETFTQLKADHILHFGDWDYAGLDEYLRLKEQFPQTQLHLPDQLEEWWTRRSKPLKKGAVITKRLRKSDDPAVQAVLRLLGNTNQFLEQQAIFPPQKGTS